VPDSQSKVAFINLRQTDPDGRINGVRAPTQRAKSEAWWIAARLGRSRVTQVNGHSAEFPEHPAFQSWTLAISRRYNDVGFYLTCLRDAQTVEMG
jgi:hypothetical protein